MLFLFWSTEHSTLRVVFFYNFLEGEGGLSFEPQCPSVNLIETAIFENLPFINNNTNNTFPEILCSEWILSQQHTSELAWIYLNPIELLYWVISVGLSDHELFWICLNVIKNGEGVR